MRSRSAMYIALLSLHELLDLSFERVKEAADALASAAAKGNVYSSSSASSASIATARETLAPKWIGSP